MLLFINCFLYSQNKITTPLEQFGAKVGDDYFLISYSQMVDYWKKLEQESPRMKLEVIGKTAEGRPQYMAIITSPENFEKLDKYKDISRKLALAENINDLKAKEFSKIGKPVIWIDGGLHATEVVGANQLIEMTYQMVNNYDEETLRFLDDLVLLLVPANPDGMDLVANWYMRESDPKKRAFNNIPRLYQKYIGHDNNRDFYMVNQAETENMSRIMYMDWFPQIMYNHHQSAPPGLIVFVPPFRDPPNYFYNPQLIIGIESVGIAMHSRLAAENKPGAGMRSTASFSIWYNGSLRTTGYFHNQIGILTEMMGNPTPMELGFFPDRQLVSNDFPFPHEPKEWRFREAIDYSITLNKAILDYASRNKETLLYNRYLMGKKSIDLGSRDSWTIHPGIIENLKETVKKEEELKKDSTQSSGSRNQGTPKKYFDLLRLPGDRDPRGYILSGNQNDFPTATKFVNALIKSGIKVLRATEDFQVGTKNYPAGSYIIKTAQAFRPHILDMLEPQDHPNDFKYENGPPIPPYDNAGWTLAYQMGIKFDRILDGFDGPFDEINGLARPLAGKLNEVNNPKGYLLRYGSNDAVIAVNRLLKNGHKIFWIKEELSNRNNVYPAGTIFIEPKNSTHDSLKKYSAELGLNFDAIDFVPSVESVQIKPVRIALWDRYGGSMPSGWTRWLLEQFEFPFEVVYPKGLNQDKLIDKYDIIVFVDGAIPPVRGAANQQPYQNRPSNFKPESIPQEYRDWLGSVTADTTIPAIKKFLTEGGSVLTIGSSTNFAYYLDLPITNHMVDNKGEKLSREQYYVPASILNVRVNNNLPIAYGLPEHLDVMFEESPVFRLKPDAEKNGISPIAWFDNDRSLRSGWAWGQDKLYGGVTMAEAIVGKGKLYLFGPEILFRGQSHGAFKFFFNGIYLSSVKN
ncbi:MAG: peptidase [Ignavibacteriae bacterium HGW-Ignavibacteriae-3]|nr:MAG: peptidase [Ignavibacteriae bacterium HGW-Ignavibacteriae-3]